MNNPQKKSKKLQNAISRAKDWLADTVEEISSTLSALSPLKPVKVKAKSSSFRR